MIPYSIPPHHQQVYAYPCFKPAALPTAEAMANDMLTLPIGLHLSFGQASDLCATLKELTNA